MLPLTHRLVVLAMLVIPGFLHASRALSQPTHQPHAGELLAAIERLGVVGSVLYVAAHPDDENSRLIAWLAGSRGLTVTYLSLTRGDGGQNLIGTEQDDRLGLLRTHELLAARQRDGGEQLFTRARDLGYTKRAEEALEIWGKEAVLGDVVLAIRRAKPDVIITRFTTLPPNHGHHTASALLAADAFSQAADARRFAEQVPAVGPWQAARLLHNVPTFNLAPGTDMSAYLQLDVGGYAPLLGKSWPEVAADSRSQHKSQGFGVTAERGPSLEYFQWLAGSKPTRDPLDGLDFSWRRYANGEKIQRAVAAATAAFAPQHPEKALPALWHVRSLLHALPAEHPWKDRKLHEVDALILACAGVVLDARAPDATLVPGAAVTVELVALLRAPVQMTWQSAALPGTVTEVHAELAMNRPVVRQALLRVAADAEISTPYWLRRNAEGGLHEVPELTLRGLPVGPPAVLVQFDVAFGGQTLHVVRALRHVWNDPVQGEQSRLVETAPALSVTPDRDAVVVPAGKTVLLTAQVRASAAVAKPEVRLVLGSGADARVVMPVQQPPPLSKGQSARVEFSLQAAPGQRPLPFRVEVSDGAQWTSWTEAHIRHDHVPALTLRQQAVGQLIPASLDPGARRIGYIPGPGDRVAESLRAVGYEVTLLPAESLAEATLGQFDAVLVGIRALNHGPELSAWKAKLLAYAEGGGRVIVQYQTQSRIAPLKADVFPYPLEIGRERVTDEHAEMRPLRAEEPLLRAPNRLEASDFAGWVQERGLYFAQKWDARYRPIFAMHDVGEPDLEGGLLVAQVGKGRFVYTGLAFFRQLPAGVPGAYRLLANLMAP